MRLLARRGDADGDGDLLTQRTDYNQNQPDKEDKP